MNTRYIYKQIVDRNLDLLSWEWLCLHGELLAGIIEIVTCLPKATGKTLRQMMEHRWAKQAQSAEAFIEKIGPIAGAIGFILNIKGALEAYSSGESGLRRTYILGIVAGVLDGILLMAKYRGILQLLPPHFRIGAIIAWTLYFVLLMCFIKNDWEKWLFESAWGNSNVLKDTYQENLEELFKLIKFVYLDEIRSNDNALSALIPSYEVKVDSEFVYLERPIDELLNNKLKNSPIVIVLKIQQLAGCILTVRLSTTRGTFDTVSPLPCTDYSQYFDSNDSINSFNIIVPVEYLPTNGVGLIMSLCYYLSTPGKEQLTLLESYEYEIVYDMREYKYIAILISETKNKQEDIYDA